MHKKKDLPKEIMKKEINVPTAPNSMIVIKLRKNCFFFTWNLVKKKAEHHHKSKDYHCKR